MLIDMFDTAMTSPSLGADDRVAACKLGEAMLLYLRGNIDEVCLSLLPPVQILPTAGDTFLLRRFHP